MKAFAPDDLANLTFDEFDGILADIRAGSRFRVFAWGLRNPEDERPGSPFYLVSPGEMLWPQRLWYSLVSAISPLLFFWSGGIVYLACFLAINMNGGRDVTDLVTSRIHRRFRAAAEDQRAREFLADLSHSPDVS